MGSIFRSEKMQLVQMIVQNDAAHDVVDAFGQEGIAEFRDLNQGQPFHKRAFTDEVKRCEEVQRKLATLKHALDADGVKIAEAVKETQTARELAGVLADKEDELCQMQAQELMLKKNHNALLEQKCVLELGSAIYAAQAPGKSVLPDGGEMEITDFASSTATSMLSYVAGVMPRLSMAAFQRVIFRSTRGNAALYSAPIDTPLHEFDAKTGEAEEVQKDFFMVSGRAPRPSPERRRSDGALAQPQACADGAPPRAPLSASPRRSSWRARCCAPRSPRSPPTLAARSTPTPTWPRTRPRCARRWPSGWPSRTRSSPRRRR